MTQDQLGEIVQAWNDHRPYLVDLAFRMLGDIGAAEDAVQDAFARLLRVRPGEIADERGWLIVVTSRLCLDQIRSARARRERPHDASEIEFVPGDQASAPRQESGDPADRVTLDDNVRLALLVVLQRLSPAERVVFVLHDIFGVPFGSIAQTVGRPAPTCRQLARRARQKIADSQGGTTFEVGPSEHRQVTDKFIAACASGDLDGLLQVLAPDAWGEFDGGPDDPESPRRDPRRRPGGPAACCTSGDPGRRWSVTRWPGSPPCSASSTGCWRASWSSPCGTGRSRPCTSSAIRGSWPSSAPSSAEPGSRSWRLCRPYRCRRLAAPVRKPEMNGARR